MGDGMKKFLSWIGVALVSVLSVVLSLATSVNLVGSLGGSLNSTKIDRHIEELRELEWFNVLYESERHRKSFFANRKVRKYLQSSILVLRLKTSEWEQRRFLRLLEKVAELREKKATS